jgi:hypothetical protein
MVGRCYGRPPRALRLGDAPCLAVQPAGRGYAAPRKHWLASRLQNGEGDFQAACERRDEVCTIQEDESSGDVAGF